MGASTGANNGAAFYRRAPLELENPPRESLRLKEKVERRRSEKGGQQIRAVFWIDENYCLRYDFLFLRSELLVY